jgi:hypothetical protein
MAAVALVGDPSIILLFQCSAAGIRERGSHNGCKIKSPEGYETEPEKTRIKFK